MKEQQIPENLYSRIKIHKWKKLKDNTKTNIIFTQKQLKNIAGLNVIIDAQETNDIYTPLVEWLHKQHQAKKTLQQQNNLLLEENSQQNSSFIIGIAGSVAVGKSTLARLIIEIFKKNQPDIKLALVPTDGFLLNNRELEQKNLMQKKGFPESYHINKLINFLAKLKTGEKNIKIPFYSHLHYDIISDKFQNVGKADIVLVEGLNVLQTAKTQPDNADMAFVSDFFDMSIYLDAEEELLQKWYVERFLALRYTAFQNEQSFFHKYAKLSEQDAIKTATNIWEKINLPNLVENIKPTRKRATLILEKSTKHKIQKILMRKI